MPFVAPVMLAVSSETEVFQGDSVTFETSASVDVEDPEFVCPGQIVHVDDEVLFPLKAFCCAF